ncbi:hypothetical protein [Helicobacter canis]|uniref:Uncharacterized protein n=1 Tax=Helicobacter canis NCTC 12740 TaxID=1357399 RepID=V8CKS4_9HELI|nr:hypothetical protein [Helicobacter canis]ETD27361.1 hypothetical protein HMPREF2087_00273 [Helicobacter canis NCTC 12740]
MKTLIYQNQEIQLNYSTTLNHLIPHDLWQCGLSLPALGLAGYLYTLPKQWKLSVTHLSKQLAMSKNTCRKYLKEIFTNPKAREVFKVKEAEINTYDFDEGFTAYDYASDKEELENFTSSVAKDVSAPNRKKVLLIQTQQQRYLLNLCFKAMDCHASTSALARNDGGKLSLRADEVGAAIHKKADSKTAQNLSTIKRDSKESLKDSSLKRARKNFSEYLDLKRFSESEQEAIKLWITYKQESSKTTLKPAQIDFQLRKITRFKEQGQDICVIIEKSLDMGWQGLFPVIASTPRPVIASFAKQSTFMDCHATASALARNDRITPKMPKNIGGKSVLRVENA